MLTQTRAKYLWSIRGIQNSIPHAFAHKFECNPVLRDDGLTKNEDDHVNILWAEMNGSSCWKDAFHRILRGE